jgi:hypothetical protein
MQQLAIFGGSMRNKCSVEGFEGYMLGDFLAGASDDGLTTLCRADDVKRWKTQLCMKKLRCADMV